MQLEKELPHSCHLASSTQTVLSVVEIHGVNAQAKGFERSPVKEFI